MAQGPTYWPFFPWLWNVLLLLRFKRRNGQISAPGPQIKKIRTLSFLQLLNFEKAKYPHFFIYGSGADILAFIPVTMERNPPSEVRMIKWPYFGFWATNEKYKDTFFSSTFKVWESKVSLVILLMAQGPRYWHFLPLMIIRTSLTEVQKMKWPYLSSWVTNQKNRTLSFLQLSKIEKAKWP